MRQSLQIIKQCILLARDECCQDELGAIPEYEMERVIVDYKTQAEGIYFSKLEKYIGTEAPKGEFGVYLVSGHENKPTRCKIRSPGYFHLQGLDVMVRGHYLADVATLVGTQDIVFGEVDR